MIEDLSVKIKKFWMWDFERINKVINKQLLVYSKINAAGLFKHNTEVRNWIWPENNPLITYHDKWQRPRINRILWRINLIKI